MTCANHFTNLKQTHLHSPATLPICCDALVRHGDRLISPCLIGNRQTWWVLATIFAVNDTFVSGHLGRAGRRIRAIGPPNNTARREKVCCRKSGVHYMPNAWDHVSKHKRTASLFRCRLSRLYREARASKIFFTCGPELEGRGIKGTVWGNAREDYVWMTFLSMKVDPAWCLASSSYEYTRYAFSGTCMVYRSKISPVYKVGETGGRG